MHVRAMGWRLRSRRIRSFESRDVVVCGCLTRERELASRILDGVAETSNPTEYGFTARLSAGRQLFAGHVVVNWTGTETLTPQCTEARLYENGLLCRLDDRGDPVVQISPPLIADRQLLDRIVDILGDAVEYAWGEVQKGMPS